MKTKNLILASLIAVAAIPAFAAGVQNKDPYTNGQAVTKADPYRMAPARQTSTPTAPCARLRPRR